MVIGALSRGDPKQPLCALKSVVELQTRRSLKPSFDPTDCKGPYVKGKGHTLRRIDHTNAETLVITEARASKIGAK